MYFGHYMSFQNQNNLKNLQKILKKVQKSIALIKINDIIENIQKQLSPPWLKTAYFETSYAAKAERRKNGKIFWY